MRDPIANREYHRRWREAHPNAGREAQRRWRESNRDRAREVNRESMRKSRELEPEVSRGANRRWRQANPELHRERNRGWLIETQDYRNAQDARVNAATRETATKTHRPWTAEDESVARRPELTAIEVAILLNRTVWAVRAQRRRMALREKEL